MSHLNIDSTVTLQSPPPAPIYEEIELENVPNVPETKTVVDGAGMFNFEDTLKDDVAKRSQYGLVDHSLPIIFTDLTVHGVDASLRYQPTIFSIFNPLQLWKKVLSLTRPTPTRAILSNFEGAVKGGEMLLVLGRPGSGCSTLLKTLANQREGYERVDGEVMYGDGIDSEELKKRWRGDIGYSAEEDIHFPTLTVASTLRIAATARTPARSSRLQGISRKEFQETIIHTLSSVFGLKGAQNTVVGDENVRGVSGGEKKRVSIAEMLSARVKVGCWDNSTRGLDAATALEFAQALRTATNLCDLTTVVSIYQVPDRITSIFDKICLIYEGRMIYYGPTNQAIQYFIEMGFQPKDRQTVADFLVSITNPLERTIRPGSELKVPKTPEDFVRYYRSSSIGLGNSAQVKEMLEAGKANREGREAYKQSAVAEKARGVPNSSPYTIGILAQIGSIMLRRVLILRNDPSQVIQVVNFTITSIIMGSLFLKLGANTNDFFPRGGVLFFSVLFGTMQNSAEIPTMYAQRPIVARQMRSALYFPFIDALSLTVVDIPITVFTQAVFALPVYWMTGLQRTAENFFTYVLIIVMINLTTKAFFRGLAASFANQAAAMAISGVFILGFVLYTGYLIPVPSMIGALRWISYINPLRYGFEALITNEFHNLEGVCSSLVPFGPGYENVTSDNRACTTVGSVPGRATVNGDMYAQLSFNYSHKNLWRNFGILVAFWIAFSAWFLYATQRAGAIPMKVSPPLFKQGADIPEEKNPSLEDEESGRVVEKTLHRGIASQQTLTGDRTLHHGIGSQQTLAGGRTLHHGIGSQQTLAAANPYLASRPIFSWQHLNYDIPSGNETRRLLSDVSGYVLPGKLIALMGESGAGKTTLLNVLAERVSTGVITGDRLVNGLPLPRDFARRSGYCQQMDTHLQTSTVREALMFSALLRQPASVPIEEKRSYVEEVIKMCEMEEYADAVVGTPSQGLNIERRKRLTIGVELAAKPELLLFLDEPTSGLDSQSAWTIVNFLKSLAARGQAILCTIHQPSSEIFQQFDKVLLLQKGGRTCYFGDIGQNAETLIQYFEHNGGRRCRPEENPAEYILDVIGAGATAKSSVDWHGAWRASDQRTTFEAELQHLHTRKREDSGSSPVVSSDEEYAASTLTQFTALYQRCIQYYIRSPTYLISKLLLNISAGLFIGFTFFKAGNSIQGLQNKLFAVFMPLTIMSLSLSSQLQVPFIDFRTLWKVREGASKMYSWIPLTTASILVELPFNIIGATFFFLPWYWTVGFPNTSDRVGFQWFMTCVFFPLYFTTFAQFAAAMASNPMGAALAFTGFFAFGITFNGVMQPFSQLIHFWHWMYYLSPFTWVIESIYSNGVSGQAITCSTKELVHIVPPSGSTCAEYLGSFISANGGYLVNSNATSDCQLCPMSSSDTYLASLNMSFSHRWRDVGFMCAYIVFNIFLVYAFTYIFQVRKNLLSFKRNKAGSS